jgi:hypothetical protein
VLIDCFPGFNEIALAEFRISYLADYVDRVIIAESNLTHSGNHKPLFFSDWLKNNPNKRIEVLQIPLEDCRTDWEREIKTRESLIRYAANKYPEGLFILSDLDEVPSHSQIMTFKKTKGNFCFNTPTSYRYANWIVLGDHEAWSSGVFGDSTLSSFSNGGRLQSLPLLQADEPGHHLSYLSASDNQIELKLKSFAHQELNRFFLYASETLAYADKFQIDHLGRFFTGSRGLIEVKPPHELRGILAHALKFNRDWFNFPEMKPRRAKRLFASLVISCMKEDALGGNTIFDFFIRKQNKDRFKLGIKAWFCLLRIIYSHSKGRLFRVVRA